MTLGKDEISYVSNDGREFTAPVASFKPTRQGEDNHLEPDEKAAIAFAKRTKADGDGWVYWATGAGYAVADVKETGVDKGHWYTR
jgi:hypothetical protein